MRARRAKTFSTARRVAVAGGVLLAVGAGVLFGERLQPAAESTSPQAGFVADRALPPEPVEAAVPAPERASVSVLHLHRLGHCQGRLIITRDAVTFVPDERTGGDAFAFQYGEFLHSVDVSTLTIRSHTRPYRFKVAAGADPTETGPTLTDVGAMIARFARIKR